MDFAIGQKGEMMDELISRQAAISIVEFECGERKGLAQTIVNGIKKLPYAQPKNNCSEIPNGSDTISRQAAIDAICAVCGNDCDKSEFVYNAPQDEQVILCPEHYCLCNLPPAQPEYEPVTAEDFAKTMSENTLYGYMAWHGEALELMERQGFVICKKTM